MVNLTKNPPAKSKGKGTKRRRMPSDYAKELQEKQGLKNLYGLKEHQFERYVKETMKKRGKAENLAQELIQRLERRLDNVVFRLGFALSLSSARQLVSHAHFLVNKKPVNIPSFELKKGDVISVKGNKQKLAIFKELPAVLKKQKPPKWLKINPEKLEGEFLREPSLEEVAPPAEVPIVFEFYSR